MKCMVGGSLLFAAVACVTPAQASDADIFAGCDGFGKPGRSGDDMGKPANAMRSPSNGAAIDACNQALSHPKLLPEQTLRRAHLLRARALAYLQAGNMPRALDDLARAAAATSAADHDALYRRSMAVSLDLLRALADDRLGNTAEALRLAREAAAARPYSLEVQRVAAHLFLTNGQNDAAAETAFLAARKLDPDFAVFQLTLMGLMGDFKGMAALAPPVGGDAAPEDDEAEDGPMRIVKATQTAQARIVNQMLLAYARATTGDAAGARREFAAAKARIAALPANRIVSMGIPQASLGTYTQLAIAYEARIESRIAVLEGRKAEAITKLQGIHLPTDSVTKDLFKALGMDSQMPGAMGSGDNRQAAIRKELFGNMIGLAMIEPETEKTNSVYKRSRPNVLGALAGAALTMGTSLLQGVKNTDGFSAKENGDGSVLVSLTGQTTAPAVVREMTLLRAAELAIEAGKPAFVIEARNDYTRILTTRQRGEIVRSVPSGYKTNMTISYVAADSLNSRALDAKTIVDALGPYYYQGGASSGT